MPFHFLCRLKSAILQGGFQSWRKRNPQGPTVYGAKTTSRGERSLGARGRRCVGGLRSRQTKPGSRAAPRSRSRITPRPWLFGEAQDKPCPPDLGSALWTLFPEAGIRSERSPISNGRKCRGNFPRRPSKGGRGIWSWLLARLRLTSILISVKMCLKESYSTVTSGHKERTEMYILYITLTITQIKSLNGTVWIFWETTESVCNIY